MKPKLSYHSHHGKINSSRQISGIAFTEVIYAPQSKFPKHAHRDACFCLVHQGGYTEVFGNTTLVAKPNSLIFRPPEEIHSNNVGDTKVRCSLIEFDAEWFERLGKHTAILDCPGSFDNNQLVWLAMRIYNEFQQLDDVSPLVIEGLALEMLAQVTRSSRKNFGRLPPRWLSRVKEFLQEQFSEQMTLSYIAESADVHPAYLANAFRQHYHRSVGEYLRQLRIEFACREIVTTDTSLVEIALTAGFSHQAHFTTTFKRSTGMTPAQYRLIFRQS